MININYVSLEFYQNTKRNIKMNVNSKLCVDEIILFFSIYQYITNQ